MCQGCSLPCITRIALIALFDNYDSLIMIEFVGASRL